MGLIRMGPPQELVLELKRRFGAETFVETGTFRGDTAIWAAGHFRRVVTVEASEHLYRQALPRVRQWPNVEPMFGPSVDVLRSLASSLSEATIYWLDSHWCGGDSFGAKGQCPLLQELQELRRATGPRLVLIDDARLFLGPPPEPNDPAQWPAFLDVADALREMDPSSFAVVTDDVIVCVPDQGRAFLRDHCQGINTVEWRRRDRGILGWTRLRGLAGRFRASRQR